ncbi:thioredoxin family protein [Pareuzebyella sediminis]|uniref:thioredoxin family protein n=1 Tax=Pareuzebyella sediminis TaxID=2607998 RepID=UPI0011ECFD94|nr:thioredoxin family protein [Pareuzebyella sediminis]
MKYYIALFILFSTTLLSAQNWQESFEEALEITKDEDKVLILVFAGSDWCAPCIKLDKDVWQSDEFKAYAEKNFVLYKADFPRKKANRLNDDVAEENGKLAEKYNPKGHFPLVVLLNKKGEVLATTGYKKLSAEAYITHLNDLLK